jgi:hypothetical protein
VIRVDGEIVGAASDYSLIDGLLDGILDKYKTSDTISARFLQSVTIDFGFVSDSTLQDLDELKSS